MSETSETERQLLVVRRSFHSAIVEYRATTDELQAVTRELGAFLLELESRAYVRPPYSESPENPINTVSVESGDLTALLAGHSVSQLRREADRTIRKGREAMRESISLRWRTQQVRNAMRDGADGRTAGEGDGNADGKIGQRLSKRELQVLTLMVEGKSSKEIAAALGISFKTAVTHRASIMGKLNVHEIASVVREAIHRKLV